MFSNQWLRVVQNELETIRNEYNNPSTDTIKLRDRLKEIKRSCDYVLDSWASIDEELSQLLRDYPDLNKSEEEVGEEVWVNEGSVRVFRQGQGFYELQMFNKAQDLFKKLVEEEPEFILGRLYLGLSQFHDNLLEKAKSNFTYISFSTEEHFVSFAHLILGCIAVKEGSEEEAKSEFKKVLSISPTSSDAWFNLGACHFRLKDYSEAIPCFYQSLSSNEDDWEAMYYLSECYLHYKQLDSVSFWRLAALEKRNQPEIIKSLAYDYEQKGEADQAIYWYKKLLNLEGNSSVPYHGIVWNLSAKNNLEEATLWIKKGLSLFPNEPNLLFAYSWLLSKEGSVKKAKEVLGDLYKVAPSVTPTVSALSTKISLELGDVKDAENRARGLIGSNAKTSQSLGHYLLGRIYLEEKDIKSAVKELNEAHILVKEWKEPLFYKGVCHLIEGDTTEMRSCWEGLT